MKPTILILLGPAGFYSTSMALELQSAIASSLEEKNHTAHFVLMTRPKKPAAPFGASETTKFVQGYIMWRTLVWPQCLILVALLEVIWKAGSRHCVIICMIDSQTLTTHKMRIFQLVQGEGSLPSMHLTLMRSLQGCLRLQQKTQLWCMSCDTLGQSNSSAHIHGIPECIPGSSECYYQGFQFPNCPKCMFCCHGSDS